LNAKEPNVHVDDLGEGKLGLKGHAFYGEGRKYRSCIYKHKKIIVTILKKRKGHSNRVAFKLLL